LFNPGNICRAYSGITMPLTMGEPTAAEHISLGIILNYARMVMNTVNHAIPAPGILYDVYTNFNA
jgi:hypothetical protein